MAFEKVCECGRFNVRKVKTGERSHYNVNKETNGNEWIGKTPIFVMEDAVDGLCARCKQFGVPELSEREIALRAAVLQRGSTAPAKTRRALAKIDFYGGMLTCHDM